MEPTPTKVIEIKGWNARCTLMVLPPLRDLNSDREPWYRGRVFNKQQNCREFYPSLFFDPAVDRAAIQSDFSVLGRFLLTRQDADVASFKTQTLRNVLMTAPISTMVQCRSSGMR
jgi:hypothetical protein